jgi:hypothetical protein
MAEDQKNTPLDDPPDVLQVLNTYNDGKMRRYSLLFTVNGGAFAIAKLLGEQKGGKVLGELGLKAVAIGAVIFTCLMWLDIFSFGQMMRTRFSGGKESREVGIMEQMRRFWRGAKGDQDEPLVFGAQGKFVLGALCTLLILGWTMAAFGLAGASLALLAIVVTLTVLVYNRKRNRADSNSKDSTEQGSGRLIAE